MPELNIVDILIILALIVYVLSQVKEGFIVLSKRLLVFFGAMVLAFLWYEEVAAFFSRFFSISPGVLDAVSFVLLFILIQIAMGILLSRAISRLPEEALYSEGSKVLASIPALVDGVIVIALALLIMVVLPVFPQARNAIERSTIGSILVNEAASLEIYIDQVFGRATRETLGFLTIQPEEGELVKLPFKAERLMVDADAERRMLELVNSEREKVGLSPLVVDETIVPVARDHSRDMWERSYFSHENPDGKTPFDRMEDGEVEFSAAGENLALARTVERAHNGLMNSPGYRRNILDPIFTRVGIGVIDGGIYGKMFTQNFAD